LSTNWRRWRGCCSSFRHGLNGAVGMIFMHMRSMLLCVICLGYVSVMCLVLAASCYLYGLGWTPTGETGNGLGWTCWVFLSLPLPISPLPKPLPKGEAKICSCESLTKFNMSDRRSRSIPFPRTSSKSYRVSGTLIVVTTFWSLVFPFSTT
jgi:hypothetical protein